MTLIAVVLMYVVLVAPGEILTFISQHLLSRYDDRRILTSVYTLMCFFGPGTDLISPPTNLMFLLFAVVVLLPVGSKLFKQA